jgi:menaquinone-dependent protoporphyrinogen IX oxidase
LSQTDVSVSKPRVLLVYYTYTQQSRLVAEAMADVLRERGCEVRQASIGFTDKRWSERFTRLPMKHAVLDIVGMLPAQLRGATGEIEIPDEAQEGDYDLICIGSPTWFFRQSVPIRSYLKSDAAAQLLDGKRFTAFVVCRRYWRTNLKSVRKVGTKLGGRYVDGTHFTFAGGQIRSFMALISYFAKGENRERYLGLKIPPSMLGPDFSEQARAFANELADELSGAGLGGSPESESRP